jgi:hypothetical protein
LVAVDTLVHNFLHRTGILRRVGAEHTYGERCYRAGGCADILALLAAGIDARQFNPTFPKAFPRFVQHAIWRYCAGDGFDICNGNRIDDDARCDNRHCQLFRRCDRVALRGESDKLEPFLSPASVARGDCICGPFSKSRNHLHHTALPIRVFPITAHSRLASTTAHFLRRRQQ